MNGGLPPPSGAFTTILVSLESTMTADGGMKTWSLRIDIAAIVTASDSGSSSPSETAARSVEQRRSEPASYG